ncbi:MAG TPA: tetratricopeptide repeat protein [Bacteroidota bacterium]|nr:tetratricopeptide repeat protein [Bacteroidota bacterium]
MRRMNGAIVIAGLLALAIMAGCSGSKKVEAPQPVYQPNDNLALQHFLEGSLLDQKGENAKAILEYNDALQFKQDAAIYHALARDYSQLGKNDHAMQAGRQATRLAPNVREYHETLAEILYNASELDGAIKEYESIIALDSSYIQGWYNLANLVKWRSPQQAVDVYEKIIERFGPDGDVYFQMAQIYNSMNRLDKATDALKGMLSTDPSNFEIKKILGDTYLRRDSVEQALKIYDELAELNPENLELRASIAHAYLVKQDYTHAAEQFESVMRKDTLSVDEQLRFGQIFVSFVQKDSAVAPYAVKLFNKIKASSPTDWRPYWFLGAIDNVVRDDSGALQNYRKVKELASWNPDGWVGIASIYYDQGKFDEAISLLSEAKNVVPDEFRIYFLLGISYQRLHKNVDAAMALEKSIQLNDKSIDALTALGLVYDEMKLHTDSDSMYERAIRLDPTNHLLLNNYAYSMAERGTQLDRALAMSKEAVRQQPTNQSYLDTYGWIYYKMGQYEDAERYIRKAIEFGSVSPVIHEHLGDIYFKLSQKDKALEYWEKALKLDSSNTQLKEKIQRGSL